MPRSLTVRKPNTAEFRKLNASIEDAEHPRQRRRAHVLVLYASGLNAQEIAHALDVHPNTVYHDLRAFQQCGLACLLPVPARGAPPRITPTQIAEMQRLAEIPPYELGLPWGRWSLAKLGDYLRGKRIVRGISREHLRRLLKKGAFACVASNGSWSARILNAGLF